MVRRSSRRWCSGSRCCPTGCCSTPTTATAPLQEVHRRGLDAAVRARPPQHARGRVPAAHRPDAGRLSMARDPRSRPAPSARRRRCRRPALTSVGLAAAARPGALHAGLRGCGGARDLHLVPAAARLPRRDGLRPRAASSTRRGRPTGRRRQLPRVHRARACSRPRRCRRRSVRVDLPGDGRDQVAAAVPRACSRRRCGVVDVLAGHLLFVAAAAVVTAARLPGHRGAVRRDRSPWAGCWPCPVAVLTGLAFAAPIFAFSATRENDSGFAMLFRFGIDADVPVLRHVLPGQPAARLAASRRLGRRRCGTASTCAATARWDASARPAPGARGLPAASGSSPASVARGRRPPPAAGDHERADPCGRASPGLARRPGRHRAGPLPVERNVRVYRRQWLAFASGFFEPVFYLFSVGVGVGALVGDVELPGGRTVAYTAFVAPAMLASSAMNGALYDATFNLFFKLKYARTYDVDAGHAGHRGRRRGRRDRLGADPRRVLLAGLPRLAAGRWGWS